MRRFLVGFLATVGALVLLFVVGVAAAAWLLVPRAPELPERVVLTVDLREALPETTGGDPLLALGLRRELTLPEAVLALERAAADERVAGLVARVDGEGPGLAQAQELRDAVRRLRDAGKFTLAFADSFGEFGPGTRGYYLASAFDEVHLQPLGAVGLTGLLIETPLLRDLLDNLGVEAAIDKRGRYKGVGEMFTEQALSEPQRETLEAIASSIAGQFEAGIGEGRGLDRARVAALVDGGPYAAEEAAEAGLVDGLSYRDEVMHRADELGGPGSARIDLGAYGLAVEPPPEDAPVVALIQGIGRIQRGTSDYGPAGGWVMGGDTVAEALGDAIDDPEVQAILFRIDSGGGSAVASDTIARQVRRAVAADKPVIVAMADTAASGGYWIAMDASTIVARPGTLTGSIGVLAGKPVLSGFWDEIGVNWGRVQRGANADMWSPNTDYGPRGRARLEAFLDRVYEAFTDGVARGRGLSEQEVQAAADGRVWTGEQALEVGLVDDLGGFARAVALAREAAGVAADEPVRLRRFPAPRPPWEQALEFLRRPAIALEHLHALLAARPPDTLSAPPLVIR